ncbi:MAG TPA: D-alanyl-D-alanine carboxypeptidase/D-alanyl-D-alanine-endopeptidase [Ignavibacteriales bacterium]|nr:D-alanyl-D-alanine carboxypeptidase/D-alanyl-D-alanine-endopeptidase [Ignavibacteriales bacterium]
MRKFLLFFLPLAIFSNLFGADDQVTQKIDKIVNRISRGVKYGIMVYNPETKDTVYRRNETDALIPASNVKLFTTGAALSILGGDYKLSTKLLCDDYNIADGVINGNLYIKGFGNSLMTAEDLDSLALMLRAMGIHKITGSLVADNFYFDSLYNRKDWIENDKTTFTMPPISALTINRNMVHFTVSSAGKYNSPLAYSAYPSSPYIKIRNNAKVTKYRSRPVIKQNITADGYEFIISSGLRKSSRYQQYSLSIDNPGAFIACLFQGKLDYAGIETDHPPMMGKAPENTLELGAASIYLKDLVSVINKRSDNFLAENLFKTLGAYYNNREEGSSMYAVLSIAKFVKENEIFSAGSSLVDGSGLSRFNLTSTGSLVALLDRMYSNRELFNDFYNSLSVAGVDGTLADRLNGTYAENNLHGKTGTLRGVSALSGYLQSRSGEVYIVSIIFEFNRGSTYKFKGIEDQIIRVIAES